MLDYNNGNQVHTTRRLVYGNEFLLNVSDDEDEDDDTEIYHGHPHSAAAETHKLIPLSSSIGASIMMANTTPHPQVKYHSLGTGFGRSTSKRYTSWAIIVCTILFMLLLVYIPILQNVQTPRIGELDDIDCDAKQFVNCMNSRRTGIVMIFPFGCILLYVNNIFILLYFVIYIYVYNISCSMQLISKHLNILL